MAEKDDYNKFDAASYLHTRYPNPEAGRNSFLLQCFHDFVQKYKNQWDGSAAAKFLEVGGGPNIMPLISIAPHTGAIVFSEYAPECRKLVQLWKTNGPGAHDWSPFVQHVVNKLEGNPDPDAAKTREDLIRSKICVIPCNILADSEAILEDEAAASNKYDIISTNTCIEACVKSETEYSECLVKLRMLLKPEGFLIGTVYLGVDWWKVKGVEYHAFSISKDGFLTALQMAGFILLEQTLNTIKAHSLSNCTGVMFYVAKPLY